MHTTPPTGQAPSMPPTIPDYLSPTTARARGGLNERALHRATHFIEQRLGERIGLVDIAGAACMSQFHFARMFRVSTGTSPMKYVAAARIRRARERLSSGERNVAALAAALGFCDQSHFTRTFRRATGCCPSLYARERAAR